MFRAQRVHHQEVKIALHSFWYHHAYRWPSHAQVVHKCGDTRGCVMQFLPPDDEHMCSKQVEAWNKLTVKQKVCSWSWLIIEINVLRCTVSKTSKLENKILESAIERYGMAELEYFYVWAVRFSFLCYDASCNVKEADVLVKHLACRILQYWIQTGQSSV